MGNRSSTADKWDSSDEGGSDYEHKYDFHTSVLRKTAKSPYDGFESDYEDDDNFPLSVLRKQQLAIQAADTSGSAPLVGGGGDADVKSKTSETGGESGHNSGSKPAVQSSKSEHDTPGLVTVAGSSSQEHAHQNSVPVSQQSSPAPKVPHQAAAPNQNSSASANSNSAATAGGGKTPAHGEQGPEGVDVEDVYETAGEGADDDQDVSDDDSLSTITPPRTRPQSDSEYSVDVETDSDEVDDKSEEEEDLASESQEYDTVMEETASSNTRSRTRQEDRSAPSRSLRSSGRASPPTSHHLPQRVGQSPDSCRLARKRQLSPQTPTTESRRSEVPRKKMKQITPAAGTPTRIRFGYISSDSESDAKKKEQIRSLRTSGHKEPSQSPQEIRSLTARKIRQAARRAASQFVETSRKILREAKTAARILSGSASKRRSSAVDDGIEMATLSKHASSHKRSRRSVDERMRDDGSSGSERAAMVTTRSRRAALKRKASSPEESPTNDRSRKLRQRGRMEADTDSLYINADYGRAEDTAPEVRKNGGLMRKFTRSDVQGENSQSQPSAQSQVAPASAATNSGAVSNSMPPPANTSIQKSATASGGRAPSNQTNPFQEVQLIPSSSNSQQNSSLTDSIDSITRELDPSLQSKTDLIYKNPFASLLPQADGGETPQPVAFTSGSVWARINMRTSQPHQPVAVKPDQPRQSPVPVPSGQTAQRMATCSSPQLVNASPSASPNTSQSRKPNTPRTSSLTLTGQFTQSGRFAFLLEDILQVTVSTGDITSMTTNAIVISTDPHLRHQNPLARCVASAAGPGFARSCQEYLRQHSNGLQVCEVLDTPAGGRLPQLTSHILHVIVPGAGNSKESGDFNKQRKLLLCTYLNCLKHAAEKLQLQTIAFPLIGGGTFPADECIHTFFSSLLVYLAERTSTCPLHGIQLIVNNPAIAHFAAEVLESRLEGMMVGGVDATIAAVFRDYFGIEGFTRNGSSVLLQGGAERNSFGKPAVKRRRL